ncbi:hypothetical protein F4779DRAFT_289144 [Xylariaceae sp. FL0662B]|nr:hypothetical protein F4779DRAFT_289144 [Xylariaceae sp. FL0662B]
MPTHAKRPIAQAGEGSDEDYSPVKRKKTTSLKKPAQEKGTPTKGYTPSQKPPSLQKSKTTGIVTNGSPAVKQSPITKSSQRTQTPSSAANSAPLGHFPGSGNRAPQENLSNTPPDTSVNNAHNSQPYPGSLSNGVPPPFGLWGNCSPVAMSPSAALYPGLFTPMGNQMANLELSGKDASINMSTPQGLPFTYMANANTMTTPTRTGKNSAQKSVGSAGSKGSQGLQQTPPSRPPSQATHRPAMQPFPNMPAMYPGQENLFSSQLPVGSSNFDFFVPNPMGQNTGSPAGSVQGPHTPLQQSIANTPPTSAGKQVSSTPGSETTVASSPIAAPPGTWSAPRDENRFVPKNIFQGLENHMATKGVHDKTDRLWIMGVQYGIGLGIQQYKTSLMNELAASGRLFGRPVLFDSFGENGPIMRRRIEKKAAEHFDLMQASLAGDEFAKYAEIVARTIADADLEDALPAGGMIGTAGMFPDTETAGVGAHTEALDAALADEAHGAGGGSMPGPNHVSNTLQNGSFTAGGDFIGGIDMSRLDGTAGMVANALNAKFNPGGMPSPSSNPSPTNAQQDTGDCDGPTNGNMSGKHANMTTQSRNGNVRMEGTEGYGARDGGNAGAAAGHRTTSNNKRGVPVLKETENGKAYITMAPQA